MQTKQVIGPRETLSPPTFVEFQSNLYINGPVYSGQTIQLLYFCTKNKVVAVVVVPCISRSPDNFPKFSVALYFLQS